MSELAINHPVQPRRGRPAKELHTADLAVGQRPPINMDAIDEREPDMIEPVGEALGQGEYLAELAFNEEPVTIRIERSSEKYAPKIVECWVNGRGAEIFFNGKWHMLGVLPIGEVVTTRRKYVEVLARAKPDSIHTDVIERDNEDPQNILNRFTHVKYPFSIIRDDNPKGVDWLTKVMAEG